MTVLPADGIRACAVVDPLFFTGISNLAWICRGRCYPAILKQRRRQPRGTLSIHTAVDAPKPHSRKLGKRMETPFIPKFGAVPAYFAGRGDLLEKLRRARSQHWSSPDANMLVIGNRGTGKTALLIRAEREAAREGWVVASVSAADGDLPEEMTAELLESAVGGSPRRGITGVQAAGFGLDWSGEPQSAPPPRLRHLLRDTAQQASHDGRGVLLVVDELHASAAGRAAVLASAVQHVTARCELPVAFLGAALPSIRSTLLRSEKMTFFHRCARGEADILSQRTTRTALETTAGSMGGHFTPDALDAAAAASGGHPYLIQLIGYHAWQHAADPAAGLSLNDVHHGTAAASDGWEQQVLTAVWSDLPPAQRGFLLAMAHCEQPARLGRISAALGRGPRHADNSRSALAMSGTIHTAGRARFVFSYPMMREWLLSGRADLSGLPRADAAPPSPPLARDRIAAALAADRSASYASIARELGVNAGYVGRVARDERLRRDGRRIRRGNP